MKCNIWRFLFVQPIVVFKDSESKELFTFKPNVLWFRDAQYEILSTSIVSKWLCINVAIAKPVI